MGKDVEYLEQYEATASKSLKLEMLSIISLSCQRKMIKIMSIRTFWLED